MACACLCVCVCAYARGGHEYYRENRHSMFTCSKPLSLNSVSFFLCSAVHVLMGHVVSVWHGLAEGAASFFLAVKKMVLNWLHTCGTLLKYII